MVRGNFSSTPPEWQQELAATHGFMNCHCDDAGAHRK